MPELLLNSIMLGLLLSALIGPVFFMIIETSIHRGFGPALRISLGAASSDLIYIFLGILVARGLLEVNVDQNAFRYVGGSILTCFGIYYLLKKTDQKQTGYTFNSNSFLGSFIINMVNPSVFLFWFGAVSYATSGYHYNTIQLLVYLVGALTTMVLIDVVKIYVAAKIRRIVNPVFLSHLNKVTGIVLIAFGANIIFQF